MGRFRNNLIIVMFMGRTTFSTQAFSPTDDSPWSSRPSVRKHRHESTQLCSSHDNDDQCSRYKRFRSLQFAMASNYLTGVLSIAAATCALPSVAFATVNPPSLVNDDTQGIPMVTQSEMGKSLRSSIVRGAQIADKIDLKWERFSDSLRDEAKCDPRTNRRMFDNGFRRDGTRIGNPVLGALCIPEPLQELDTATTTLVMKLAQNAALETLPIDSPTTLAKKQEQVANLVGPAFSRAASQSKVKNNEEEDAQVLKRQAFNRDLYTQIRAVGEFVTSKEQARDMERAWGDKLLAALAPTADKRDYTSPFPKPDGDEFESYNEGALLDALGAVSVALQKLQAGGLIGHWEISIPEDDYWNVVTLAVDDDISIGGQILGRERNQPLSGSQVQALVRSAMESQAKMSFKMDTFFIDPTTTRQELYNPTQLLLSLSDLGQ